MRLLAGDAAGGVDRDGGRGGVMGAGGVAGCGKAQNCVEVCPKEIPLVDSISVVARDTTKRMLFGWLLK